MRLYHAPWAGTRQSLPAPAVADALRGVEDEEVGIRPRKVVSDGETGLASTDHDGVIALDACGADGAVPAVVLPPVLLDPLLGGVVRGVGLDTGRLLVWLLRDLGAARLGAWASVDGSPTDRESAPS